jgi:two-component system, NtrC family, sensor histidine kinase GlrK
MSLWARMRLSVRLGVTHGALVLLLGVLLVVTLQGLLRMLGVMSIISDQRLSSIDAEEEIHRSAWAVEVSLRHARNRCGEGASDVRERIAPARASLGEVLARHGGTADKRLRDAASQYEVLADQTLAASDTCALLAQPVIEERRMKLDEKMTETWIDRLHELHTDIETKEATARRIGSRTTMSGLIVAGLGTLAAVLVVRLTARSVTRPIARLAADARRLGDGYSTPIEPVGGPPELEALRRDLERTREKLLGLDRLKQSFLAGVSHELRSPLGRLREALALLGDGTVGPLSAPQARLVTLARRACEQEVSIVEALLDMSRVTSGMPVQREAGCDLEKVVEAAVAAEKHLADERGVEICVECVDKPPTLNVDSALIERAVANLVRNAVSVSARGAKVHVQLRARTAKGRREALVDVSDDGPGLSEAVSSRIFQPFSSAPVGERAAGIGIGLSLAREIARAHGGELDLAQTEHSTCFRMQVPVEVENDRLCQ